MASLCSEQFYHHGVKSDRLLARIFEPFFTTKSEDGTGLGLSMVYGTVQAHNGFMDVESEQNKGTSFRIFLPLVIGMREEIEDKSFQDAPIGRGEKVLLVDDNTDLLSVMKDVLSDLNYEVVSATNGVEALEMLSQHEDVACILSDVVMPDMGGVELARQLRHQYPLLPVVLMSGYNEEGVSLAEINLPLVFKPFEISEVSRVVFSCLNG